MGTCPWLHGTPPTSLVVLAARKRGSCAGAAGFLLGHDPTNQRLCTASRYEKILLGKPERRLLLPPPVHPCADDLHLEWPWSNAAAPTSLKSLPGAPGPHNCSVSATIETLRPPAWSPQPPLEGGRVHFATFADARPSPKPLSRSRWPHSHPPFVHLSRRRHSLSRRHALPRSIP